MSKINTTLLVGFAKSTKKNCSTGLKPFQTRSCCCIFRLLILAAACPVLGPIPSGPSRTRRSRRSNWRLSLWSVTLSARRRSSVYNSTPFLERPAPECVSQISTTFWEIQWIYFSPYTVFGTPSSRMCKWNLYPHYFLRESKNLFFTIHRKHI